MRINIKALSANEAYRGVKKNTIKHKNYKNTLLWILPNIEVSKSDKLHFKAVFGFSSKGSDLDNALKPFIDALQKKYGFNDNQIYEMELKKEIVPKGQEFIDFDIIGIK